MINEKIALNPEDIYAKEFKIDARGYRPQEVDNFLDLIIKDYVEFNRMFKSFEVKYQELLSENRQLKSKIRLLEQENEDSTSDNGSHGSVSNVDLLRRISQLEKIVYRKE